MSAGLISSQRKALDASRNIVLRAGAGSGKTTVLVSRYLRLLEFGLVDERAVHPAESEDAKPLEPGEILALTFTRKAAAEMRERVLARLAERLEAAPDEEKAFWRSRRDALDQAFLGTIHGFCKQTLEEFSLRAGLDPSFEVAEEFVYRRLRDSAIQEVLEEGEEEADEHVARLAKYWERAEVEESLVSMLWQKLAFHEIFGGSLAGLTPQRVEEGLFGSQAKETFGRVAEMIAEGGPADAFRAGVASVFERSGVGTAGTPFEEFAQALSRAREALAKDDKLAGLAALDKAASIPLTAEGAPYQRSGWFGRFYGHAAGSPEGKRLKANDNDFYSDNVAAVMALRAEVDKLPSREDLEFAPDVRSLLIVFERVETRLREMLDERFLLTQDDLLVMTRDLLRSDPDVAGVLASRYRQIMVDEFQDTDPVQWEIVRKLAASKEGDGLAPAKLFIVGDGKQSIYRFRGADVAVFKEAEREAGSAAGGRSLSLADNFRTLPSVLEAINRLFENLLAPSSADEDSRPAYEAEAQALQAGMFAVEAGAAPRASNLPGKLAGKLAEEGDGSPALDYQSWREANPDLGSARFGLYKPWKVEDDEASAESGEPDAADDPEERRRQAAYEKLHGLSEGEATARAVLWALGRAEGPPPPMVRDENGEGFAEVRPAEPGDVMVLLQARTSLGKIERAFRKHRVEYVVESGLGFYGSQEVLDVRDCLAFLADQRDDVALAGALRSPIGGLKDDALSLLALQDGETWRDKLRAMAALRNADAPEAGQARALLGEDEFEGVAEISALLLRWLDLAPRLPLADLVQTICEESGALAAYAMGGQGPQRVANLDKLADLARDFELAGMRGVGPFVAHLDEMESDPSVREGLAEVADAQAGGRVRVATVHGSKGREAPVVIVADADRWRSQRSGKVLVLREQTPSGVRDEFAIGAPKWYKIGDSEFKRAKAVRGEIALREVAESRRLFYVAATRARDHLVLLGQADGRSQREWLNWMFEFAGEKPAERTAWLRGSMIDGRWLPIHGGTPGYLDFFAPMSLHAIRPLAAEETAAPRAPATIIQVAAASPDETGEAAETSREAARPRRGTLQQTDLFSDLPGYRPAKVTPAFIVPGREPDADAPLVAAFREGGPPPKAGEGLSGVLDAEMVFEIAPSAAGLLDKDPAKYYREAVLGIVDPNELSVKKPARSLSAAEVGSIVHRAFQEGLETPDACRELAFREAAGLGLFREDKTSAQEIEKAARVVEKAVERFRSESDLGGRLAEWKGEIRREEPLCLRLGALLFEGRLDLLALPSPGEEGPALIVDFKTSGVEGVSVAPPKAKKALSERRALLEAHAEESGYFLQLKLYALALERAGGLEDIELVVYYSRYAESVSVRWSPNASADLVERAHGWAGTLFRGDFLETEAKS